MKIILIIFLFIHISGCGENEKAFDKNDTLAKNKSEPLPIKRSIFKGMYSGPDGFSECISGNKFIISPDGENKELETVVTSLPPKNRNQKLYIEAEGFSSAREKIKGKGFDTLLVITRFIKLDTAMRCD